MHKIEWYNMLKFVGIKPHNINQSNPLKKPMIRIVTAPKQGCGCGK
jgi:hypothetical protein